MTEPPQLYPTKVRLKLLADVRDLKVCEPEEGAAEIDHGGGDVEDVADDIWQFERAGWVYRPDDTLGWRLTQRGLDILEGRRAHG